MEVFPKNENQCDMFLISLFVTRLHLVSGSNITANSSLGPELFTQATDYIHLKNTLLENIFFKWFFSKSHFY